MSILKDLMDVVQDVGNNETVENIFKQRRYSSVSKRASEGTLQFPTIVSKSLDIETLQMVTKALERQYSTFIQIVTTMSPTIRSGDDITKYLRQFHQNTDTKADLNDLFNTGLNVLESYTVGEVNNSESFIYAAVYEGSTGKLVADNKNMLRDVLENFNPDKLNDKFIPRNYMYNFKNKNLSSYHNKIVTEAKGGNTTNIENQASNVIGQNAAVNSPITRDSNNSSMYVDNRQYNSGVRSNTGTSTNKLKDMDVKMVSDKILRDNDVKKANELIATTLHLRIMFVDKEGATSGYHDFIIGVKATMHPVASDEIIRNLVNGCRNNNKFFDFIRWTTGETTFVKDFLLNMNEMKDDVVNRSKGASSWWITLKRRKNLSKLKSRLILPNKILPNATIVISQEEVDYIKVNFGYDLNDIKMIDKIMREYFLLGFVIVDNSTQIVHFLFDGKSNFESVTFTGLEREGSNKANDFKEMLKLVNRN